MNLRLIRLIVTLLAAISLTSCSRQSGDTSAPVSIVDGKVLSQYQVATALPRVAASEAAYAEVDSTKLGAYYSHFLAELGHVTGQNAPHWDANANCTCFSSFYADLAKAEYYLLEFHSFTGGATAPAVGTVWYVKDGVGPKQGHAIVVVLTEKGRLFIEPQNGAIVTLSPTELASAWQVQF